MPTYYKTNAIVQRVAAESPPRLAWPNPSSWQLLYGTKDSTPVTLVLVRGDDASHGPIEGYVRQMAATAQLPIVDLTFDDDAAEVTSVRLRDAAGQYADTSLDELKARFAALGLPVTAGGPSKAVNRMTSSAYHDWQRQSLGAITVSDLDLVRIGPGATVVEVVELKRSFISLDRWRPYRQDFANFNLLAAFCEPTGARLTIAFNRYEPPSDDTSRISLFRYTPPGSPSQIGVVSFDEFVAGAY